MSWDEIDAALNEILTLFPSPVPLTIQTNREAVKRARLYGLGIYDALIAASALQAKCQVLCTEDLQDGQVINGRLTIRNPFRRR